MALFVLDLCQGCHVTSVRAVARRHTFICLFFFFCILFCTCSRRAEVRIKNAVTNMCSNSGVRIGIESSHWMSPHSLEECYFCCSCTANPCNIFFRLQRNRCQSNETLSWTQIKYGKWKKYSKSISDIDIPDRSFDPLRTCRLSTQMHFTIISHLSKHIIWLLMCNVMSTFIHWTEHVFIQHKPKSVCLPSNTQIQTHTNVHTHKRAFIQKHMVTLPCVRTVSARRRGKWISFKCIRISTHSYFLHLHTPYCSSHPHA